MLSTKPNGSQSQQDKQQEWEDVARQVAADMQNFHQQGTGSGDIAQEIDTFEISIQPFEDCCTIFAPDRPKTNPKIFFLSPKIPPKFRQPPGALRGHHTKDQPQKNSSHA